MKALSEAFRVVESILFWSVILVLAAAFEAGVVFSHSVLGLFLHRSPSHPEAFAEPTRVAAQRGHMNLPAFWR